jgi:hypothetical protein
MDAGMIACNRRGSIGLMLLPALAWAVPTAATTLRRRGRVALAADAVWWDPEGSAEPCRFAERPQVMILPDGVLDVFAPHL